MHAKKGIRTRGMLVAPLVLVIAIVTAASLLIVRNRLRVQISESLSMDLTHSVNTFENIEAQRLDVLKRENALLANLPSLKALMTTSDKRTIADASVQFWKVSGNDLFALADKDGRIVVVYTQGTPVGRTLYTDLSTVIGLPEKHYVLSESRLFEYSVRPLYFGDEDTGTLLGYVISGDAINSNFVKQISQASAVDAAFVSDDHVVVSTLSTSFKGELTATATRNATDRPAVLPVAFHGEHFLTSTKDLSGSASAPLRLVVLKSFDQAEKAMQQINHLLLIAGLLAIAAGVGLMLTLSQVVTEPLEALARGVRAFGAGDVTHALPQDGTLEVRELSVSFAAMRSKIQETNRALLEAERLATIGRMASSVSHDLRHYLAAVYANSEFLASSILCAEERKEIFADIKAAVHGTTDMLDSLLIFSRSSNTVRRSHELMATLLERALALVRSHPDAQGTVLSAEYGDPTDTAGLLDGHQIERAMYNLLLNACQSSSSVRETSHVRAILEVTNDTISLSVIDDGPGVPNNIRESLFEPFISEGKQKGTGLGLTLVHSIAEEHGGFAKLISSRPGETIFRMEVKRTSGNIDTANPKDEVKLA